MRKKKLAALWCAALLLLLCGCAAQDATPSASDATPEPFVPTLDVIFFSCGKADSTLIKTPDHTLLIDTGTDKAGKDVVSRLKALGVTQLDALIISHPHKDHVGGADRILDAFPVKAVYEGPLAVDSKQVDQYKESLRACGLTPQVMTAGDSFSLGDLLIEAIGPVPTESDDENDLSLVLRITWGESVLLFPGDAEKPALAGLLASGTSLRADVLKVPHHGRGEDNSALFFSAVSPRIAVIPCERGTDDGLPEEERVVRPLRSLGAQVYVTHDGEVCVQSDGHTVIAAQYEP